MGKSNEKKSESYTSQQLKELAGEYKTTDNPTPEDFSEEMVEATKRKNSRRDDEDQSETD